MKAPTHLALVVAVAGALSLLAGCRAAPARSGAANTAAAKPSAAPAADPAPRPHRVIAYYFHTNTRCVTCRKLEAYSKEALDAAFAEELADGRLVWRVVNTDQPENKHFVKDYRLFTKSVVLVEERDGREVRWTNLARIWQLVGRKDAFLWYVQGEARTYLAALES